MNIQKVSVLTLVKNRKTALLNLLEGLKLGTLLPSQVVIIFMNEEIYSLPTMPFPVECYSISTFELLPLAKARNLAVEKSNTDHLIFLDVDCIPSPTLISDYNAIVEDDILLSGQVVYLEKGIPNTKLDYDLMNNKSKPDPVRARIFPLPYELFWSLNFACTRNTYNKIGGFDERFKGYGAEDTDFSFTAKKLHVKLKSVDVKAYHQYHESYSPPLNHFVDIIENANVFFKKWQIWPMEGWLKTFKKAGLISWNKSDLQLLRLPSPKEIEDALKH